MAFDRRAGGHAFDFDREICVKCGMSREYFEDNGQPACRGRTEAHRNNRIKLPVE